jgi:tagatose 1,6-diphosphate aldolase
MRQIADLSPLADAQGHLRILTIDARAALRKAIAEVTSSSADEVPRREVVAFKRAVLGNLASLATAVLIDDEYCVPDCLDVIPSGVGVLFPAEESNYLRAGTNNLEYKERIGWNEAAVLAAKPHGVKFLVHYRADGSPDVVRHQREIVQQLGDLCKSKGLFYIIEPIAYPLHPDEISGNSAGATWAKRRADIILDFATEFSQPQYQADLLKVEFPVNLRYVEGVLPGSEPKEKIFTVNDVRRYCREFDDATPLPWAILSFGVPLDEFVAQLEFAAEAGACGFLAGRSIWKTALGLWGSPSAMDVELRFSCSENLKKMNAAMAKAKPWHAKSAVLVP